MGVFRRVARPVILAAARSDGLRRTAERLPVTREVVHRFVPGESIADVTASVARLRDSRLLVSIDYLGEDVTETILQNDVSGASTERETNQRLKDRRQPIGRACVAPSLKIMLQRSMPLAQRRSFVEIEPCMKARLDPFHRSCKIQVGRGRIGWIAVEDCKG